MIIRQLSDIICTIIIMSFSGSALILLLFALKPLIRDRLSKAVQYFLWFLTLAALLIPVSKLITIPEAPSNIIISPVHNIVEQSTSTEREAIPQTNTNTDIQTVIADEPAAAPAPSPVLMATTVFITVYMLIALAVLSYNIFSYIRFTKKVRRHRTRARMEELYMHVGLCGDTAAPRLYRSALATTPMLIGIFKPEIVLPDREYTEAQIQSVLRHELTHLRRRDVLVKWLSVIACALHWFNPLVWLARREIDRICELSCDEAVIRNLDKEGKQSYGETLISVAADTKASRSVLSTTMCEEKEVLKERLNVIMKYQKRTWITLVISMAIITVAICAVCILGAGVIQSSAQGNYKADAGAPASAQSTLTPIAPAETSQPSSMQGVSPTAAPTAITAAFPPGEVIVFKDPVVEKTIRATLGKSEGDITAGDMLNITSFKYDPVNDKSATGTITTLDDLRYCANLSVMHALHQPVTSIEPLRKLDKLEDVCILGCSVSDLSPLAGKSALREVWISGNPITDASPVLALPSLVEFNAYYGTNVTDISALPETSSLENFFCDNKLKEFTPLLRLKKLRAVELAGVSDEFFRAMIQKYRNMSSIRISGSDIKDESLKLFDGYNLYALSLENCGLKDISGLAGLRGVSDLRLGHNQIEDISALKGLTQISYFLDLSFNNIKDLSPLENIKIATLFVSGNPLSKDSKAVLDKLAGGGCKVSR